MRKQFERRLALALALVMAVGFLSVPAMAEGKKSGTTDGCAGMWDTGESGGQDPGGVEAYGKDNEKKDTEKKDDAKENNAKESGREEDGHNDRDDRDDRDDGRGRGDDDHDDDDDRDERKNQEKDQVKDPEKSQDQSGDWSDEDRLPPGSDMSPAPKTEKKSPIQDIVKKGEHRVNWGDRIDPPDYALTLYDVLAAAVDSRTASPSLVQDGSFTLAPGSSAGADQEIVGIEYVDFQLADLFAAEGGSLGASVFEDEEFYHVNPALSDRQVDYESLQLGDVVQTSTFNGIFVTRIPKDQNYDQEKERACAYISTVFQAFDRDHPEVFWLSGKCRVRIPSVRSADGTEQACFFLVLVDSTGFTMRAPDWTAPGAVAKGIQRRDQAVRQILSTVTAETPAETVRQFNAWLTEHNAYNTTPDLTTIGNEPHECLSALEGREGTEGPVCDGYARAFKVLCDQVSIPCILENGYAKTSAGSAGTFHMWNAVEIGGSWYGVDVTWNDPVVKGVSQARSGRENEQFLLTGASTVIRGMAFMESHPTTNWAAEGGVIFENGPLLSSAAFSAWTAGAGLISFDDVAESAWYYDAVSYVCQWNLLQGTSAGRFSPNAAVTRQQLWMILARMDGRQPQDMEAARAWAVERGISDGGSPGGAVTREQLVTMLWRYSGAAASAGSLEEFADLDAVSSYALEPMRWAVENGILTGGADGRINPQGSATRAQVAVLCQRLHTRTREG